MPIRVYECPVCAFRTERIEYTQQAGPYCERCLNEHDKKIEMIRTPSAPSIRFEGEGWAKDGYASKPVRGPNAS